MLNLIKSRLRITLLLLIVSPVLWAQTKPSQLQCKNKAKEVAKETAKVAYDDCMVSVRENEAELIRQEYKVKYAKLREFYEAKLKKLKPKSAGLTKATNKEVTSTDIGKAGPAVITVLPKKQISKTAELQAVQSKTEIPQPVQVKNEPVATTSEIQTSQGNTDNTVSPSEDIAPSSDDNVPVPRMKDIPSIQDNGTTTSSDGELSI